MSKLTDKEYKKQLLNELVRVRKLKNDYKHQVELLKKVSGCLTIMTINKYDIKLVLRYLDISIETLNTKLNEYPYDEDFVNTFYFACILIDCWYKMDVNLFRKYIEEYHISYQDIYDDELYKYETFKIDGHALLFERANMSAISLYKKSLDKDKMRKLEL